MFVLERLHCTVDHKGPTPFLGVECCAMKCLSTLLSYTSPKPVLHILVPKCQAVDF